MASKLVIVALLLVAIVGVVSAAGPATKAAAAGGTTPAASPGSDDDIGNEDGGAAGAPGAVSGDVVPGPLGSASSSSTEQSPSAESPKSGATILQVSAFAGVSAAAVAGFFI